MVAVVVVEVEVGAGGIEAAVAVCLCNSATYERWGPSPALGGAPDSPCLIFEGWGCLNNSSQSSQCPARHHLSPQECGESQHTPRAFVKAELGGGSHCVSPPSDFREYVSFIYLFIY